MTQHPGAQVAEAVVLREDDAGPGVALGHVQGRHGQGSPNLPGQTATSETGLEAEQQLAGAGGTETEGCSPEFISPPAQASVSSLAGGLISWDPAQGQALTDTGANREAGKPHPQWRETRDSWAASKAKCRNLQLSQWAKHFGDGVSGGGDSQSSMGWDVWPGYSTDTKSTLLTQLSKPTPWAPTGTYGCRREH